MSANKKDQKGKKKNLSNNLTAKKDAQLAVAQEEICTDIGAGE